MLLYLAQPAYGNTRMVQVMYFWATSLILDRTKHPGDPDFADLAAR